MNNVNKSQAGYTLIEAAVAILILSIGILPSLYIVVLANNFSSLIRNNLIAANLAQEGIEVVRALRDENWFNNQPFDHDLVTPYFDCSAGCRVEWSSPALLSLIGNPAVTFNSTSGIYSYAAGTNTPFRRKITITKVDPTGCNCELLVTAEVTWTEKGGRTKSITVESHLFDWN